MYGFVGLELGHLEFLSIPKKSCTTQPQPQPCLFTMLSPGFGLMGLHSSDTSCACTGKVFALRAPCALLLL